MGQRGPAPRREAERRRRNKSENGPSEKITREVLDSLPFEIDYNPEPPEAPERWHALVQQFWDDMHADPARKWMTSGDWAAVALICETMSRELKPQAIGVNPETGEAVIATVPPKAATIAAFLKMLEHIGVTESARLRLQKEVTLFPPPPEDVGNGENVVPISTKRKEAVQ